MSAPNKKRALPDQINSVQEDEEERDMSSEGEDIGEDDEESDEMLNQEVQVDFEARNPEDSDFHGIRKLLQQLFLKANVNLSELADTIISQNYVGSVIRQSNISDEDDEEDEAMDTGDDIFGVISVLNITERKELDSLKQVRDLVIERCKQASPSDLSRVTNLLQDDSKQVGLLINERFINIPAQIALPSFQSLWKECARANQKKMKYDFSHYLMICKTYRMPTPPGGAKPAATMIYTNEEEELFAEESEVQFSFSVADQRDKGVMGEWDEDDTEMDPQRTVLIVPADKIPTVMGSLQQALSM